MTAARSSEREVEPRGPGLILSFMPLPLQIAPPSSMSGKHQPGASAMPRSGVKQAAELTLSEASKPVGVRFGEGRGSLVSELGMRSRGVEVLSPFGDGAAGVIEAEAQALIQQLVAPPAFEALDIAIIGLPGAM